MNTKTVFAFSGGVWEILRFILIFALFLGSEAVTPEEGNFLVFLLAFSGFPFTLYLWVIVFRGSVSPAAPVLAAGRLPSLLILGLAAAGFIFGWLPGGGDGVFLENSVFSAFRGWLLLVLVFLVDFIFSLNLLLLPRKEA